jgi:hypothetical protein
MSLDRGLVGSWELAGDGHDRSGRDHHAIVHGRVAFVQSTDARMDRPIARIDAGAGHLEVPTFGGLGTTDFSVSLWVNAGTASKATLGDLASFFDASERRGFSLGFQHGDACGSHRNDRNLFFGIDAGSEPRWTDYGRPTDDVVMIYALATHDGQLYAATWEESSAASPRGHVYRLDGESWVDCGSPWDCNAVTRLAVHDGRLYAGVSRVKGGGSGRPETLNANPGGRILRYEGGTTWSDCGQLPDADSIAGLVPFDGALHATPLYSQGVYRMKAPGDWEYVGGPGRRLLALGVHAGHLYGAGNDHVHVDSAIQQTAAGVVVPAESNEGGGGVFRYDGGQTWTNCGMQPDTTQVYSIETHGGELHISTWPTGLVFRRDGSRWQNIGRLGVETEVMGLASYNGVLYAGTLPHAEVYRYDRDDSWKMLRSLDQTPDVLYRRVHAMGVYRGELFCGTLPSGRVYSLQTGVVVSHDQLLAAGWRHVAAVRAGAEVELFVDGHSVAKRSAPGAGPAIDLGSGATLRLGGGPHAGMDGELAAVRLYDRALEATEIVSLAVRPGVA